MTATVEEPGRTGGIHRLTHSLRTGPLGSPGFRLLTAGQFTSTIGDASYAVALPWLVLSGGGSAASLGTVLACYGIPRTLLMAPAGNVADRFGPRRVMLFADFARCVLSALFAAFAAAHVSSLAALAPVAALIGAFSALFLPASMAMMPSLVEPEGLTQANAVYTGFLQVGSLLGPVIGGVLVAAVGAAAGFGVDAGSFLVSAVTLACISTARVAVPASAALALSDTGLSDTGLSDTGLSDTGQDAGAAAAPEADEAAGSATDVPGSAWALLRQSRIFRVLLVVTLSANFALFGTTEVALPALAHARYGADGYGAVLACVAFTGIVGALVAGKVGDRFRPVVLVSGAFAVAAVFIAAAPFLGGLPGVAAGMAVFGVGVGFDQVVSVTLIQRWAPPALLGRVWGLLLMAAAGSFPVATFLAGQLVRHLGPSAVFPISGALLIAGLLYGLSNRDFRNFGAA